ncbi:MAG TPA: hypothetical protein VHI93_07245 [Candidatus Thermoplasmatota archaeon]|nr:hypothetical protein [Candidatus Thermoplasmatota archaeon]
MSGRRPPWRSLAALLRNPLCQGCGPIHLVASEPFWREDILPFLLEGGGTVCHLLPDPGFRKESLAGSEDERLLIADCPDAPGWLAPQDVVAAWMARNVTNPALDDLLLSHPLYEYLTQTDEEGHSRGPAPLVQWMPGVPTLATVAPPGFLPTDREAPAVNRVRAAYAEAVLDLLRRLDERFDLLEVEVPVRLGEEPPEEPEGAEAA